MTDEKRRFSRVAFRVKSELVVGGLILKFDEVCNLSVGGCQLEVEEEMMVGAECRFRIILNPADRTMNVEVEGLVVRSEGNVVGIKFTSIEPEALNHLQNIIRYNSSDPDRIDEEIGEHPGLI